MEWTSLLVARRTVPADAVAFAGGSRRLLHRNDRRQLPALDLDECTGRDSATVPRCSPLRTPPDGNRSRPVQRYGDAPDDGDAASDGRGGRGRRAAARGPDREPAPGAGGGSPGQGGGGLPAVRDDVQPDLD